MKVLIAAALVALSFLSTTVAAHANAASPYNGYPSWARAAFENYGG
jgi:hypothetical protein